MNVRLTDGSTVTLRPIRPADKVLLVDALHRLSPETVRRRFLAPKHSFSRSELEYLTEVDFIDHYGIVAVRPENPRRIVGVGRWVRLRDNRTTAEVAVVIDDELQGKGLGTAMATALARAARLRGVRRFSASMLSENRAAQALFRHLSENMDAHVDGGVYELRALLAA